MTNRKPYTTLVLRPDDEWDGSMYDATYLGHIEAMSPKEAITVAKESYAADVVADIEDPAERAARYEHHRTNCAILAIFEGHVKDVYDISEDKG